MVEADRPAMARLPALVYPADVLSQGPGAGRGPGRSDRGGSGQRYPEPIPRRPARRSRAGRPGQTGATSTEKAAQANRAAAAVLSRLAAAFPQTFFTEPEQVQPLKAFLYRDLLRLAKAGVLPDGIDRAALKAFLRWYRETDGLPERRGAGLGPDRSDRYGGHDDDSR